MPMTYFGDGNMSETHMEPIIRVGACENRNVRGMENEGKTNEIKLNNDQARDLR